MLLVAVVVVLLVWVPVEVEVVPVTVDDVLDVVVLVVTVLEVGTRDGSASTSSAAWSSTSAKVCQLGTDDCSSRARSNTARHHASADQPASGFCKRRPSRTRTRAAALPRLSQARCTFMFPPCSRRRVPANVTGWVNGVQICTSSSRSSSPA